MANKMPMKSIVVLVALDVEGNEVERVQVPVQHYYDCGVELVDSAAYRRGRGIRFLHGQIYDPKGHLGQKFENRYLDDGTLEYNRTVHADGNVTEQRGKRKPAKTKNNTKKGR